MEEKLPPLKEPQVQVKVLSMVGSNQLLNFFIVFFIVELVKIMPALGHQSDVLEIKYVLGSNKALKTLKFTVNMLLTYKVSFMISQLRRRNYLN